MERKRMIQQQLSEAKNQDLIFSVAAIKRASVLARQVAMQTDTAIVVYKDDKIVRRTAAELARAVRCEQGDPIGGDARE
jgi:nicotinamide mononucleotide adenylyltransferase